MHNYPPPHKFYALIVGIYADKASLIDAQK